MTEDGLRSRVLPAWTTRSRIRDVSSRGIASYVAELIRSGPLAHGTSLPPVRALAEELRVSPATVSAAWSLLKQRGLIIGTGKSGTRVASADAFVQGLEMFATVPGSNDLRLLYPDPDLLPALDQALAGAARQPRLNEYYDSAILPELREAIAPSWPFEAPEFAVANGGADAVWAVLQSHSVPGDRILVESPTQPQMISLMLDLGLSVIPIPYLDDGLDVRALRDALSTRPAALFFQPRAHVPTGRSTTPERAKEIATALSSFPEPIVIEYDDLGPLARTAHHSVAAHLPDRAVVIRSYEKSYGPDLRLAAIGAASPIVHRTHARIRLTRQWTSRILQAALRWMLQDPATTRDVDAARDVYAARHDALAVELRARGTTVTGDDGFCVWLPVLDETAAVTELASVGILAMRGTSSYPAAGTPHIRVATSRLPIDSAPDIATLLAGAAGRIS